VAVTARPHFPRRVAGRLAAVVCVLVCALATSAISFATPARADGDPASDILLASNVFYPYQPATAASLMRQLDTATADAAKVGAPVKVAIIVSPIDLGVIPQLLGKPQEYAEYLDQEISFTKRQPLLVVMAGGYGTESLPPAAAAAVRVLPRPASRSSDALAVAALRAVDRIAAAEGHPLSGLAVASGSSSSSTGSGSSGTAVVVGLVLVIGLAAAGTAIALTLRRRRPAR
jgi:hypothetical protein